MNKGARIKMLTLMAACAVASGSIVPAMMRAADPPAAAAAEGSQPLALPAGFAAKDLQAENGIRSGLVKLTQRYVTTGDFKSFLGELASQDKDRAKEFKGADQSKLDGIIDQIQKQWKAKYGQDFDINDKNLVFNDRFQIAQGEVADPTVAMKNRPAAVMPGAAVAAGDRSDAKTEKKEADAAKLSKGRNVALVRFPATHDVPEITVSMIGQLLFWRVDAPNDRTGEQIYNDMVTHLTWIQTHPDQWPADVNDAYRMVAEHAVATVYGTQMAATPG